MTSSGVVRVWHHDQGWGIIDSLDVPGGCRATSNTVKVEGVVLTDGFPMIGLPDGEDVQFVREAAENDAEFKWHVSAVWPSRCDAPTDLVTGAYGGSMWNSVGVQGEFTVMRQRDPHDLPAVPERPALPRTSGTVVEWNTDEGWGVVDSTKTPGGAWVHFSEIRGPSDYRALRPGSEVEFGWERTEQDGYQFRGSDIDIIE